MSNYQQGKNWTASNGNYSNGHGQPIQNPPAYFDAVASNNYGYNTSYSNGHGKPISNPTQYYHSVGRDVYGYNGSGKK